MQEHHDVGAAHGAARIWGGGMRAPQGQLLPPSVTSVAVLPAGTPTITSVPAPPRWLQTEGADPERRCPPGGGVGGGSAPHLCRRSAAAGR